MQRRDRTILGLTSLGVVVLAAWLVSPSVALDWIATLVRRPLVFGLAVCLLAVVRPLFAWPTLTLSIAIGYAYGFLGVPFAVVVLVVTSVLPYWFGVETAGSGRITAAGRRLIDELGGVRGVTAARLLPAPSDAVSVAAGIAGVRFRPYLLGTALGELPWAILGISVGVSLDRLQGGAFAGLVDPWILVGMAAVAVLLLAGPCYRVIIAARESKAVARPAE